MIDLIHQICEDAGCEPKDLIVEWTPTLGTRVIGTTPKGVKLSLNVLARLDHIAQAIWLCANGQEHLYPRIHEQQSAMDNQIKEWMGENPDPAAAYKSPEPWRAPETQEQVRQDWRRCKTAAEIIGAFPIHPSSDDIIDLYQRNKNLQNADLKALLEKHSR